MRGRESTRQSDGFQFAQIDRLRQFIPMIHQTSHLFATFSPQPALYGGEVYSQGFVAAARPAILFNPSAFYQTEGVHYEGRRKCHSWTHEEDIRLANAVNKYGTDNWTVIASQVGNGRTRAQCSQRWLRGLNPTISKVSWTQDEDQILIDTVRKLGAKSWAKIAAVLGNRCDVQCRYRYKQLVKNNLVQEELDGGVVDAAKPKLPSIRELITPEMSTFEDAVQ